MTTHPEIVVIGAGAWGTALADIHAAQGRRVVLVARDAKKAEALARTRTSPQLPGITLHEGLDFAAMPPEAPVSLIAVPFQHVRESLGRLMPGTGTIVLCAKGVERETGMLGPEIVAEMEPRRPCAVLTGPNFAHEIAAGLPAAAVLAMRDPEARRDLVRLLATPRLRVYGSADPIGAALGGAAKNVIAIASGAVIGAGLGENARAALITRGLAEIARLSEALGGDPETVSGLAGLGDLILTATGGASRNYRAGLALGRGDAPDPAAGVIEGLATAPALLFRARSAGCEMPVTETVVDLIAGRITPEAGMRRLLSRALRDER